MTIQEPPVKGLRGASPSAQQKANILVIDDDFIIRTLARRLLEPEGCSVEEAVDGQAGWERIEQGLSPDLCILDLVMPRLDGIGFLRRLQLYDRKIRVITCSSTGTPLQIFELLSLGSLGHLTKPWDPMEMLSLVNSALRREGPSIMGPPNLRAQPVERALF